MRQWIDVLEGADKIKLNQKFWFDANTGEVYPIESHHVMAAFSLPVLKNFLQQYHNDIDALEKKVSKAFSTFFGDGAFSDNDYLDCHEELVPILTRGGFVRGSSCSYPRKCLNLEFDSRYDRPCRELAQDWGALVVFVELTDYRDAGSLHDQRLDLWYRGRTAKRILENYGELTEAVIANAEFTGCWIEPNGNVHMCDHESDRHHADIAMEYFSDDDGMNDLRTSLGVSSRKIDEYDRDAALQAAIDDGWMQVTCIRDETYKSLSFTWRQRATSMQVRAADQYINKVMSWGFDSYSYDHDGRYEHFEEITPFLKALKLELRRS